MPNDVTVHLEEVDITALDGFADAEDRRRSQMARVLLRWALENYRTPPAPKKPAAPRQPRILTRSALTPDTV